MSYSNVYRRRQSVGDHAGLECYDRTAIGKRRADVFTDAYKIHAGILPEFGSRGLSELTSPAAVTHGPIHTSSGVGGAGE